MNPDPYPLNLEPGWPLDFVTHFDPATCRARLQAGSDRLGAAQRFRFGDNGAFTVERDIRLPWGARTRTQGVITVAVRGSLEPSANGGTRVRGAVAARTQRQYTLEKWGTWLLVDGLLLGIGALWLVAGPGLLAGLISVALAGVALRFLWRWKAIRWYPGDLLGWVIRTLDRDADDQRG